MISDRAAAMVGAIILALLGVGAMVGLYYLLEYLFVK